MHELVEMSERDGDHVSNEGRRGRKPGNVFFNIGLHHFGSKEEEKGKIEKSLALGSKAYYEPLQGVAMPNPELRRT